MKHVADLSPPLGWDGGPCKVVERIDQTIRNPRMRDELVDKVESGSKLTNPEAGKVYRLEREKGIGYFSGIQITPHAQYRMDQRGVTVGDVKIALRHFSWQMGEWKNKGAREFQAVMSVLSRGDTYEWVDRKLGNLAVVFSGVGQGIANIVTTYWVGLEDPRPESCKIRRAASPTFVEEEHMDRAPGTTHSVLPSPPWNGSKPVGPLSLNGPGGSGSLQDGSVHEDRVRTKGEPGGDVGLKTPEQGFSRRPGLTASGEILYRETYPSPGTHTRGMDWLPTDATKVWGDPAELEGEVHGLNNPGSRARTAKGLLHLDPRHLAREERDSLLELVRSPLWRKYQQGGSSNREVLSWLIGHGWEGLTEEGMLDLFEAVVRMKFSKVAKRIAEIHSECPEELRRRAQGLDFDVARVDEKNASWHFNVKGKTGNYRVRLKAVRKGNISDLGKVDVKVSCSCDFWRFQGPEHWAKVGGYLYGSPRGTATVPSVTDPQGQHRACKHVLAVLNHVTENHWSVPVRTASVRLLVARCLDLLR